MPPLSGSPSFITEPKTWDVDGLEYVALEITLQAGSLVIGQVTANAGTNLNTSALATQTTLAASLVELQSILAKLNASLAVTGTVGVNNFPATQPISAVSLPTHGVTGPLTDAELRATPVPVSGTVTASGPLTDAQLRALAVPVSAASLPLPSNAAAETGGNLAALVAKDFATQTTLAAVLTELTAKTEPADQQHVIVDSAPASTTGANVLEGDGDADYTDGATAQAITQTPDGRLRTAVAGLVSDVAESYIPGTMRSLSLNPEGRLRVSSAPAMIPDYADLVPAFSSVSVASLWNVPSAGPWA